MAILIDASTSPNCTCTEAALLTWSSIPSKVIDVSVSTDNSPVLARVGVPTIVPSKLLTVVSCSTTPETAFILQCNIGELEAIEVVRSATPTLVALVVVNVQTSESDSLLMERSSNVPSPVPVKEGTVDSPCPVIKLIAFCRRSL